jgi:cytochrome c biogenesis protein CcmG/thiol:disulfide interchange protein DsbE
LLAQSVVRSYEGKAKFVVENYGDSQLARRFGVTRYPAIFVDDILVAKPKDFGFYGKGEGGGDGKYTPWKDPKSHEHFRSDLKRMIDLLLADKKEELRKEKAEGDSTGQIATLPKFTLQDLDGKPITADQLAGKAVLIEFWATWCPPCRGTLSWLGQMKQKYGDRLAILAIAIESEDADVKDVASKLNLPLMWGMGNPEIARSFGDISAVPTLFLFNAQGEAAATFFGAPPDLHERAEQMLEKVVR